MAETKQLILAVESTEALKPHWPTIISDYLQAIIRYFCGDKDRMIPGMPIAQVTLVSFTALASYSPCVAQQTSWTNDADIFLNEWLSAINFNGKIDDGDIAHGLSQVLRVFSSVNGTQCRQRHCILIPSPFYVERPDSKIDPETVARNFKQNRISLSVIGPTELPELIAIYNAARMNTFESDPRVENVKDFLVLISESFMEARVPFMIPPPKITELPSNPGPTMMDLTQDSYPIPTFPSPVIEIESPIAWQGALANFPLAPGPHALFGPHGNPNTRISNMMLHGSMTSSYHPFAQNVMSSFGQAGTSTSYNVVNDNVAITNGPHALFGLHGNPNIFNMMITGSMTSSFHPFAQNAMSSFGQAGPFHVVNDNVAVTNVGPARRTSSVLQPQPSRRSVELWRGDLTLVNTQGELVTVATLQGYRERTACASPAKDWPATMQVDRVISHHEMKYLRDQIKNNNGKEDHIVFVADNEHEFLVDLQTRKLCAIINLPSQMLSLIVTKKVCFLNGLVFPKEMVIYTLQQGQSSSQGQHLHDLFFNN